MTDPGGEAAIEGRSADPARGTAGADSHESLREGERLLEAAFEENPLPILISTLEDSVVIGVNRAFLAYLGRTREEVVGRTTFEIGLWSDPELRQRLLDEVERSGSARRFPFAWTAPTGEALDILLSCNVVEIRGRPCLVTAAEDVTELYRARREVEASERRFALAFRHNPAALSISRLADGVFVDVNEAFAATVGLPREQLIGRSSTELGLWPDPEERRRAFEPIVSKGWARGIRAAVVSASGERREARISGLVLELGGEPCILIQAEDVTELERTQQALAASEARFRAALDGSLDSFFLLEAVRDEEGRIVDFELAGINRKAREMTGLGMATVTGERLLERCPVHRQQTLLDSYLMVLDSGKTAEREFDFVDGRGRRRWLWQQVVPLESGLAIWAREITAERAAEQERKRLEAEFHRSQRLESLGVLAGGVAHDFNNLLTAILGCAELAAGRLPPGSPASEPLRDLRGAAERAAELTQKMLAFSGGGSIEVTWVSLNEVVEQMAELARHSLPPGRELHLALARPSPGIEADPIQIRQVTMNLLLNASEAIESGSSGSITVATGEIYCEAARLSAAVLGEHAVEGRHAFLTVADDGVGIPNEARERIFEPFFTTKFTGRGLGLAAVLGIVRAHRGVLEVDSEPGRGTRVTVLLPISRARG